MERKAKSKITDFDRHAGQRLRVRRALLGWSQKTLALKIDVTYQQIQKYEAGTNRMSAGALYRLARVLHVPLDYFAYGFNDNRNTKHNAGLVGTLFKSGW